MPAARYWRIVAIDTYAGGDLELSELHLHNAAGRVDAIAVPTSSHAPVSGDIAALGDADTGTSCRFSGAQVRTAGFRLIWDFGDAVDVVGVRLGAADSIDLFLSSFDLQSSDNGVDWRAVASTGRYPWPGSRMLTEPPTGGIPDASTMALVSIDSTVVDVAHGTPVVLSGSAVIDTDELHFFRSTVRFSGGYLSIGTAADFNFGSAPWTLEGWYRWTATSGTGALFSRRIEAVVSPFELRIDGSGGISMFASGAWGGNYLTGKSLPRNQWTHVALTGDGVTVRLYVGGQRAPNTIAQSLLGGTSPGPLYVGRGGDGSFHGWCGDVRVSDVCRYTDDFSPPESFLGFAVPLVELPPQVRRERALVCASASVGASVAAMPRAAAMARDMEFGGPGRIWGTTKIETNPGNRVPTKSRVSILRGRDKLLAREVWSDPVTGDWEASGLDTRQDFVVLAQDSAGNYQPVAADKTLPESP